MANVTKAEITKGASWNLTRELGLVAHEFYIDHTFVTDDECTAAILELPNIFGVLSAARIDDAGDPKVIDFAKAGVSWISNSNLKRMHDAAEAGDFNTEVDDKLVFGSELSDDLGLWIVVISKAI